VTAVHLGFEVGSGRPVEIPVRHLAITGQTQEAGKTTALEALIARSGLRAVTFVTKRGEGAFGQARRIDPYFREQADWQFVASILEASRGEKLKFERAWIIRASKGARTLADVHRNVRKAMETAKGLAGDVYLTLDAYLEVVVPAISRVRWAPRLELAPGVNAVDLTALSTELQHLVIKSSIEWVLEHEEQTVVVVPEAWKFLPQGRGTPVKLAAAAYIRQGAGLKNYLWLDSQDLGGIEKEILRSVPVWVLGVQREANEIKRTLDNIPAGIAKPSKADIATLELGQFFACWGKHAIKTYVQPAWMNAAQATQVAAGALEVGLAARLSPRRVIPIQEETVNETEARALREDNDRLKTENAELLTRLERLEATHGARKGGVGQSPAVTRNRAGVHSPSEPDRADARAATSAEDQPAASARGIGWPGRPDAAIDREDLYQAFKARLIAEAPALIRLLTTRAELEIQVSRKTLQLDEFSLKGRIARLLREGFFSDARGCGAVRSALKRTGPDANTANIGRALDDLTRDGFVTDEGSGYREVPGMKVNLVEPA
jgi:hypothetical protein